MAGETQFTLIGNNYCLKIINKLQSINYAATLHPMASSLIYYISCSLYFDLLPLLIPSCCEYEHWHGINGDKRKTYKKIKSKHNDLLSYKTHSYIAENIFLK